MGASTILPYLLLHINFDFAFCFQLFLCPFEQTLQKDNDTFTLVNIVKPYLSPRPFAPPVPCSPNRLDFVRTLGHFRNERTLYREQWRVTNVASWTYLLFFYVISFGDFSRRKKTEDRVGRAGGTLGSNRKREVNMMT